MSLTRVEAIARVMQLLAEAGPKFRTGIINPATNQDTGEELHLQFLNQMQRIILGPTKGVIYKMRPASDFYVGFVQKTKDAQQPEEFALEFVAQIQNAQNSALDAAKSVLPESFWPNLDDLKER